MKRNAQRICFEGLPFFAQMHAEAIEALRGIATLYELEAGETFFRQGDPAHSVFTVQSGGLQLVEHTPDGKSVNLKLYGRGDFFGMLALSGEFPHPAGAVAAQDTEVIGFRAVDLRAMVLTFPSLGLLFIDMLVDHTHHAHQRIRHLATERVGQRVARALLHFHEKFHPAAPGPNGTRLMLTQQDLAEFAGSTVETVNRTLRVWEDRQMLRRSRMHIELLDVAAIRRCAEGQPPDGMARLFDGILQHDQA
ncbi:Crp/Fnr family transcriptional regulator [Thioalkalivibrio paradoxus]|uniref:Crp/Fnr family transcriptional regulator n=1 Tax=Thioalkalivibrio paradoxus ARh 1 TaxID=713585 RepID=W0DTV1_9GAMM|nr:Crp/Fnr family transcriptional regulator [Thioalkalivibrio paradoxus]AHF00301.1 hypothetical protein THITH_16295 [Thioalkalivibrio paradoxus ARh 1]